MKLKDCFESVDKGEIRKHFFENKEIDENDTEKLHEFKSKYSLSIFISCVILDLDSQQDDRDRKMKIYSSDSSKGNSNDTMEVELVNFQDKTDYKEWLKADVECEDSLPPAKIAEIALKEKLARVNNWDI